MQAYNIMPYLPKSITWQGYGKSRLSKVTYPEYSDEEVMTVQNEVITSKLSLAIRSPISIKHMKQTPPVLVINKRKPHRRSSGEEW